MNMFIVYIGIIGPQFCFDYTNFRASLAMKIISFNGIKNIFHLVMLIIFYVDVIIC